MPGERTPMAKRKAQEAKKPRKAKTNLSDMPAAERRAMAKTVASLMAPPETVEVKPHTRKAPKKPARKLGNGLNEIEAGKRARKAKTPPEKPVEALDEVEPLDPSDEADAEVIRISEELVATETRRMQRCKKLTHTSVRAALRETAGILVQSAELLGVSRAALYNYIKRHELEGELEDIRDDILDQAEATIKLAIMGGNLQTAMWYLTKMGHKRGYAERHTVQQVGANGQPVDPRETILAYRPVLSPDSPPPASPVL